MSLDHREIPADLIEHLAACGAKVQQNVPLASFTTFRLGGTCPALIDCPNGNALKNTWPVLAEHTVSALLMGGGSNLLINDAGIDDVVIRYVETDAAFVRDEAMVNVSAGMSLDDFARTTAEAGLDGAVCCSGIPGTVGGAIVGNAGAFGEQIGDRVISVEVMTKNGSVEERFSDELGFAYRCSNLQESGDVVISASIQLTAASPDQLLVRREEILKLRAVKHPDWKSVPTAGSFFKNIEPTSKAERRQAAGWFLEQAGALSMRVGGARTFERHANIIIGEDGCRAADVLALSEMMAEAVKEKFDLTLHREVKLIGFK